MRVPEGFLLVEPEPEKGWTVDVKTADYEMAHQIGGRTVSSGPVEITWSGGSLPDNQVGEFAISGRVANDLRPGTILYFKLVQWCPGGKEEAWIGTSGADENMRAPSLLVTK